MAAGEACVHNELCGRRNGQVLDAARFKQGNGANEASFVGDRTKKLLEVRATPSSVPPLRDLEVAVVLDFLHFPQIGWK
jgi:hypothetical protein